MNKHHQVSHTADNHVPFFESMQRELNQLFDRFRAQTANATGDFLEVWNAPVLPAMDVSETDSKMEITAEIPGVKEDDLDISISQDVLTLRGEKSSDHEVKERDYHLVERRFGSFQRRIPLGFVPAEGAVDASFKDGVLKISIPKPEAAKSAVQKIRISTE